MTKKKKDKPVAEVALDRPRPTVSLYGDDVIKNATVDQKVTLRLTGKVVEIGRERYDKNRLHQRIEIDTVKKMMTGADLDAKVSRKVNDA